jgi:hypothetical protein
MIVQTITYTVWMTAVMLHVAGAPKPEAPQPEASIYYDVASYKRSTCT